MQAMGGSTREGQPGILRSILRQICCWHNQAKSLRARRNPSLCPLKISQLGFQYRRDPQSKNSSYLRIYGHTLHHLSAQLWFAESCATSYNLNPVPCRASTNSTHSINSCASTVNWIIFNPQSLILLRIKPPWAESNLKRIATTGIWYQVHHAL